MAKAKKPSFQGAVHDISQGDMLEAIHQIWLAGIGAVATARKEGPQRFEQLLEEGARISDKARKVADNAVRTALEQVQATVGSRVKDAQSQANDALDNLEKIFQARVHRALSRIGVPSADQIASLSKRVQALSDSVGKLAAKRPPAGRSRSVRARSKVRRAA
jgi:poly(hydroxyalkanoate) granule-associated protein